MAASSKPLWRKSENRHNDRRYRKNREIIRQIWPYCIRCFHVDGIITPMQEVDHWIPISQGGSHDLTNLSGMCRSCHWSKTLNENAGRSGFPEVIDPKTGWPMDQPDYPKIIADAVAEYHRKASF